MCVKIFKESHTYQAAFFNFLRKLIMQIELLFFLHSKETFLATRALWGIVESVQKKSQSVYVPKSGVQPHFKLH